MSNVFTQNMYNLNEKCYKNESWEVNYKKV